ncbi:uncharacterized protein LOC129303297 [Prosopis cineraria]|uniref:uncharacterized protein LOC129303297 n=1 Tax=Prosopis cineraria TaxID=364024 RepID=UPI002410B04E|nr:uncharacterized protein LOC129303297 [Prosopis cineraria]
MVVVVVVVVRVVVSVFLVDDALDGAELLHVAGNSDRTFLIEAIFFFGLLQELQEERVVDVDHRNHEPLLLLSLTHQYRETTFRNILQITILLLLVVQKVDVRKMEMKINHVVVAMVLLITVTVSTGDEPHVEENPRKWLNQRWRKRKGL